ncbi:MAG: asparagine synthetase B, partial [Pyrinomonadaceae bacterium]|nr:asparagine synthetase B [Pyrinomonadaceae bacterium]
MSAIFGMHYLDDRPVPRSYLARMSEVLAHRGPDGSRLWCDGTVGLGQRMLWTTPESLNESLPFQDSSGDFVITTDARLDNRDELISNLDSSGLKVKGITDSELILAAYRQWGECCTEKLLGDFAFAIWDKRERILFCARDHFGVRPFYYYSSPTKAFVFASEMKAVFALPEVPYELNEVRLGDHLADVFVEDESTFYRGILRLPPAHSMTVSRGRVSTRRYFALDAELEVRLGSDDEYAEAFRELFTKAVGCRLRATGPVGVMLS